MLSRSVMHMAKTETCPTCNKEMTLVQLVTHVKECHSTSKDVKCDQCDRALKSIRVLRQHSKMHMGEARVVCPLYNKVFVWRDTQFFSLSWTPHHSKAHYRDVHPVACHLPNDARITLWMSPSVLALLRCFDRQLRRQTPISRPLPHDCCCSS